MNRRVVNRSKIKPISKAKKRLLFVILCVLLPLLSIYGGFSDGFCYERHNGTYCYKGLNKNLLAICPLIILVAMTVCYIEIKTGKAIRIFKANLSAFILFLVFPLILFAMLLSGPNMAIF